MSVIRRGHFAFLVRATGRTLTAVELVSFHYCQRGNVEALTEDDLSDRVRTTMQQMQNSPLASYIPFASQTDSILKKLADLNPDALAIMHGSSFVGDGARALGELSVTMREVFGD